MSVIVSPVFTQYIELAREQVDRLVLALVILHRQCVPRVNVQDLARRSDRCVAQMISCPHGLGTRVTSVGPDLACCVVIESASVS